jgi:hypothetical protein
MKRLSLLLLVPLACAPKAGPTTGPTTAPAVEGAPADDAESYLDPALNHPGPTLMRRSPRGFELRNRDLLVILDERTGDITHFGRMDADRNLLLGPISPALDDDQPHTPDGYIEKRDDQTWQYLGDDPAGISWRKIYCLEGKSLFITYLVENKRPEPLTVRILVNANLGEARIESRTGDRLTAHWGFGSVSFQAFNEQPPPTPLPPLPTILVGDTRTLKPNDRISFTAEMKFEKN